MMTKLGLNSRAKQVAWRYLSPNLALLGKLGIKTGFKSRCPVFVIGTGRCGTDLLVSVLGSHPQIVAFPNEANELWHPRLYPFEEATVEHPPIEVDPQGFTEVSIENWPPRHAEEIRRTFAGFHFVAGYRKRIVLKSAMVSFMLPKILKIFPDARFIHIYRSGPSVVESYVKKNFGSYSRYAFREDQYRLYCARYWNSCILEIEKAKTSLSLPQRNAYLELSYEGLCNDTEHWLDKLAGYLNIEAHAFGFDTASISNQNFKVGKYTMDSRWAEPLRVMKPAMKLKGYVL